MEKTQKISERIAALVVAGVPVNEAVDAVLGAGTWSRIASDLYDAFTKEAEPTMIGGQK